MISRLWVCYPPLMGRPAAVPLGLQLARVAKSVSRAFDEALAAAGGSRPMWLVMIGIKSQDIGGQRQIAEAIGIQGATLTHHLNAMERSGLVIRHRDPANRRMHVVALTEDGEALFLRLRAAAIAFDQQLRTGLSERELAIFEDVLCRLQRNVSG